VSLFHRMSSIHRVAIHRFHCNSCYCVLFDTDLGMLAEQARGAHVVGAVLALVLVLWRGLVVAVVKGQHAALVRAVRAHCAHEAFHSAPLVVLQAP
jgi:hypothetical protein